MNRIIITICAMTLFALAACQRLGPIYNVPSTPVTTTSGKAATASQVRGAIITAGTSLGWKIVDAGPGRLEGTLALRAHTAVVTIPYSGASYAIQYKSSDNLNATATEIHSNYNGWVQNLDRAIRAEISRL